MAAQTAGQQYYDIYSRLTTLTEEVYHNMNVSLDLRRANEQVTEVSNLLHEFSVAPETYQGYTYTWEQTQSFKDDYSLQISPLRKCLNDLEHFIKYKVCQVCASNFSAEA